MKIIDKRKDYYDFLVGIYGEDPKIILDRRSDYNFEPTVGKNVLYFCGQIIDIYFDGKICHIGEDLRKFDNTKTYSKKYEKWFGPRRYRDSIYIDKSSYYISPRKDDKEINSKNRCPIIIVGTFGKLCKYPLLSNLDFSKYMTPEDTFLSISNWLASEIDKDLIIKDNLSDTQKLENKGFDKKKSFRPNMK